MSRLDSLVYLLPELVRTLLDRRMTVHFPFTPLELPSYYRGRVVAQPDLCKGCGLCVRDCPALALELERESRDQFRLIDYPDPCAYCGQCSDDCRHGAIDLVAQYAPAVLQRDALTEVLVEREPD